MRQTSLLRFSRVMNRSFIALAVLTTVALLPVSVAGAGSSRPALRITSLTPLQVAGRHFKASERVLLRVSDGTPLARRTLRTTRAGTFRTTFTAVQITDRCSSDLLVRALGGRGSRASAKLPQAQCPPALSPP